jgi:hypothetical protein
MNHSRIYCWFRRLFYRMVEEEAWAQAQATGRLQRIEVERQTDRIAQLDTQQVQAIASLPTTTNVLRQYTPRQDSKPGEMWKFYKIARALGMIEDRRQ